MNVFKIVGMALLLFVISIFAQNVGILWHIFSWHGLEYLLHGVTTLIVTVVLIKLLVYKGLKHDLYDYRITNIKIYPLCLFLGIIVPVIVNLIYIIFIPGEFMMIKLDTTTDYIELLLSGIFISGIIAPIVEEIIFRGILLKYIEEKTNIVFAMFLSSFLFSVVHLFNGKLVGIDLYLLILAGFMAGMLYATATYLFNSIWAGIVMHMCWNLTGIFTVTNVEVDYSLFQYVIKTHNVWLTGGAYGMDASLVAIGGYTMGILFLLFSKYNDTLKL